MIKPIECCFCSGNLLIFTLFADIGYSKKKALMIVKSIKYEF